MFKGGTSRNWGKTLLTPTRIYVDAVNASRKPCAPRDGIILGLSHITGGGLVENVPRILPARRRRSSARTPGRCSPCSARSSAAATFPKAEMWRTFNMGLGLVIVIRPDSLAAGPKKALPEARLVGEIVAGKHEVEIAR